MIDKERIKEDMKKIAKWIWMTAWLAVYIYVATDVTVNYSAWIGAIIWWMLLTIISVTAGLMFIGKKLRELIDVMKP